MDTLEKPRFVKDHYYHCTRNGHVYRCTRVDSDGYIVLTRLSHEGLIEIDPAPEFWKFFEPIYFTPKGWTTVERTKYPYLGLF